MERKQSYTVEGVAGLFNCHYITVIRKIRAGELKAAKFGRDYRISRTELERFWEITGRGKLFEETGGQSTNRIVIDDPIDKEFKEVCADRGEDPEAVIKNLMANYVKDAIEAKEAQRKEEQKARDEIEVILEMRRRERKVDL